MMQIIGTKVASGKFVRKLPLVYAPGPPSRSIGRGNPETESTVVYSNLFGLHLRIWRSGTGESNVCYAAPPRW